MSSHPGVRICHFCTGHQWKFLADLRADTMRSTMSLVLVEPRLWQSSSIMDHKGFAMRGNGHRARPMIFAHISWPVLPTTMFLSVPYLNTIPWTHLLATSHLNNSRQSNYSCRSSDSFQFRLTDRYISRLLSVIDTIGVCFTLQEYRSQSKN